MSKAGKIILIIALVMLPVGILAVVLGVFLGGKTGWSFDPENPGDLMEANMLQKTVVLSEFDSLEINVSSADVDVELGDSYSMEYKVSDGREPVISEDAGKLTVTQPEKKAAEFHFGFGSWENKYKITIPQNAGPVNLTISAASGDITLDRVKVTGEVNVHSGDVMLNDIEGEKIEIKTNSGDIECDKVNEHQTVFSTSSGDIEAIRIYANDINCHTSSGDIEIYNSQADNVDCVASSGDISLELNGDADDYSYKASVTSGDISVNDDEIKEEKYEKKADGNKKITAEATSGDIEISVN